MPANPPHCIGLVQYEASLHAWVLDLPGCVTSGASPDELPGRLPLVLDWAPPASAFASFDAWAPEVRTIRDVAAHVLQLEAYYRGGLHDGPSTGVFEPVADAAAERARTVDLLRSLTDDERSRVYRPVRPSRTAAEEWTVRKIVRRIISHERAHTAEIWQRRSWVLIGAPALPT